VANLSERRYLALLKNPRSGEAFRGRVASIELETAWVWRQ
jgi:hypothetical protein